MHNECFVSKHPYPCFLLMSTCPCDAAQTGTSFASPALHVSTPRSNGDSKDSACLHPMVYRTRGTGSAVRSRIRSSSLVTSDHIRSGVLISTSLKLQKPLNLRLLSVSSSCLFLRLRNTKLLSPSWIVIIHAHERGIAPWEQVSSTDLYIPMYRSTAVFEQPSVSIFEAAQIYCTQPTCWLIHNICRLAPCEGLRPRDLLCRTSMREKRQLKP